jgi:hypothetical protein
LFPALYLIFRCIWSEFDSQLHGFTWRLLVVRPPKLSFAT